MHRLALHAAELSAQGSEDTSAFLMNSNIPHTIRVKVQESDVPELGSHTDTITRTEAVVWALPEKFHHVGDRKKKRHSLLFLLLHDSKGMIYACKKRVFVAKNIVGEESWKKLA